MVRDWQAILKNTCSYLIEDFLNKIHKLISLCFFSLRYWKACFPLLLYPSVCCRPFFLPRSVYSYIYIYKVIVTKYHITSVPQKSIPSALHIKSHLEQIFMGRDLMADYILHQIIRKYQRRYHSNLKPLYFWYTYPSRYMFGGLNIHNFGYK